MASKDEKTDEKVDDKYTVDVNSGAAPQPGAWVGPHGVELGYASPVQEAMVNPEPSQDEKQGLKVESDEKAKPAAKKAAAKKA